MCLLADQDLANGALRANTGRLVDCWTNQRELRLRLTDDSSNDFTYVDADLHSELLLVAEGLRLNIALNAACKVSDSH